MERSDYQYYFSVNDIIKTANMRDKRNNSNVQLTDEEKEEKEGRILFKMIQM